MLGAERVNVNVSAAEIAERPAVVVTVTSTVPTATAGVMTLIEVDEMTVNEVAATEPNETPVTSAKFVPVMRIESPPKLDPDGPVGPGVPLTPLTVGSAPAGIMAN